MKSLLTHLLFACFYLGVLSTSFAQEVYRIKGKVSIKTVSDSSSNLTMGDFYYDKTKKNVVYSIKFPSPEVWVFADTTIYRFAGDSLMSTQSSKLSISEFSIFHLALTNKLENYGLKNSIYHLEDVELSKGLVISTWAPPKEAAHVLGKVVLSTQKKQLFGIVFLSKDDELIRKQLFKEYTNLQGIAFPTKIYDTFYAEEYSMEQITTYSNISINEKDNSEFYDFTLPDEYRHLFPNEE